MQKLYIKNFRQITETEIEIRDIMFLIGEQASGKSTIAKLIYFFKSLKQDYFDLLANSANQNAKLLINIIQDKFALYFGYTSRYADDFEIKYYYSEELGDFVRLYKAKFLQVEFSAGFWNEICNKYKEAIDKQEKRKVQKYPNFQLQDMADKDLRRYLLDVTSDLFHDRRDTLFFPAGRNITVSYPEQFQLLFFGSMGSTLSAKAGNVNSVDMALMKEFFSYSKFLVDYFSEEKHHLKVNNALSALLAEKVNIILHGSYKNTGGNERLFFDDENYVPLNLASSGQQETIRIIQDLVYIFNEQETTSRIIEEPEAHLFPAAQAALVQLMVLVANYTGTQFIVTTHSPFIMTSFNNLLYYQKVLSLNEKSRVDVVRHFGTSKLNHTSKENLGIKPDSFQAYALKTNAGEYCKSIFDKDVQMIGDNYIDEVSEQIYGDFDFLYSKI